MNEHVKRAVKSDCRTIISNITETTAEARIYINEMENLVDVKGASEDEVYSWLKDLSNAKAEDKF